LTTENSKLKSESDDAKSKLLMVEQELRMVSDPSCFATLPLKNLRELREKLDKLSISLSKTIDQKHDSLVENLLCKICMEKEKNVLLLPCRHFICCSECVSSIATCPLCRAKITQKENAFNA